MTAWLEVIVPTAIAAADDVAAELIERVEGARPGTQVRGDEIVFWVPVERGEETLEQCRAVARLLADRGFPVDVDGVRSRSAAPEEEWRDAWKKYFHVTRLTRRIVVVPSWESHEPAVDDIVIDLDPGQAFGTGAHASTQLVLEALEREHDAGLRVQRFCDVGCGSGILSIATAKLWPESSGVAVDIDPLAVSATDENSAQNGVRDRIVTSTTAAGDIDERFELVLANIQAHVLLALKEPIGKLLAPGGVLILSGLLTTVAESVAIDYADAHGLSVSLERSTVDPEWTSAVLRQS